MAMETITIDGELIRVNDLSEPMQNMTVLFEHIAEQETDARKQLAMCEAGRMEITRRMVATYKHEQLQASKAAESDADNVTDIKTDEESANDDTTKD